MKHLETMVLKIADVILKRRRLLMIFFTLVTIFFAYSATHIQLNPGFLKKIPLQHPYMRTMMEYMKDFSGANMILVNVRWKGQGDIYNSEYMNALKEATDEVFFIPGINRNSVSSLFTPSTYYIEITEEGFKGEPVVPKEYSGSPAQMDTIRHNVLLSGKIGLLVANNQKSALIRSNLQEVSGEDPKQSAIFYQRVMTALGDIRGLFESPKMYVYTLKEDQPPFKKGQVFRTGYVDYGWKSSFMTFYVQPKGSQDVVAVSGGDLNIKVEKNPDYNPNLEVNIIGFAQLLADVINGLIGVFGFFALAFGIIVVLLFWYTRSLRMTGTALLAAFLPVLWLLGLLPLIGFGIDPLSILVPFLIFAIGVSHAVQMTNAWRLEMTKGSSNIESSREAFSKLFIPGTVALLTNALGFGVIMLIDIPIVRELGITACLGVLLMIITNKVILPIALSYSKLEEYSKRHSLKSVQGEGSPIWHFVAGSARPKVALAIMAVMAVVLVAGTLESRHLIIGDTGIGAPELWPDSRYNQDSRTIAKNYNIGVNVLSVIVEAKKFEGDSCLHYPVVHLIDEFESYMNGVAGVESVASVASIGRQVIAAFNEGNPRWRALPRTQVALSTGSKAFDPNLGFNTANCRAIQVMIFTKGHEGANIAHIIEQIKKFRDTHQVSDVKMRLASGNVGVMAATNEAVAKAEVKMLLALFGALIIFCLIAFRSWTAVLCVLIPLTVVCILCNALMAMLGIGLKVATLPVIALGVGVGVDYGLYLLERVQHHMHGDGMNFQQAFLQGMRERGSAAVFTAITMAVGVGTWVLSDLKFQADMGMLLAFMFLVNMLGAIFLLPALGTWFYRDKK